MTQAIAGAVQREKVARTPPMSLTGKSSWSQTLGMNGVLKSEGCKSGKISSTNGNEYCTRRHRLDYEMLRDATRSLHVPDPPLHRRSSDALSSTSIHRLRSVPLHPQCNSGTTINSGTFCPDVPAVYSTAVEQGSLALSDTIFRENAREITRYGVPTENCSF